MVHLSGLRKRASYDELINYINTDKTKLRYPNRKATFLANSPQLSSLLELDDMDEQDKEIKKAKVAVPLRSIPALPRPIASTTSSGVNAEVQVQPSTSSRATQNKPDTNSTGMQHIPITSDAEVQYDSAFCSDLDDAVVDMTRPPVKPDVIVMAIPDLEDIASEWGGSTSSSSSSRASSKTSWHANV